MMMTPGPDAHTARRRGDMLSSTRQLQRAVPRGFPAVAVETLRETLASQQVRASLDPEPLRPRLAAAQMIIFRPSESPRATIDHRLTASDAHLHHAGLLSRCVFPPGDVHGPRNRRQVLHQVRLNSATLND